MLFYPLDCSSSEIMFSKFIVRNEKHYVFRYTSGMARGEVKGYMFNENRNFLLQNRIISE